MTLDFRPTFRRYGGDQWCHLCHHLTDNAFIQLDSFDGSDLYTFPVSRLKANLCPSCDLSKFVSILRVTLENQSSDISIYIGINRSLPELGSALPNISNVAPINRCWEINPLFVSQNSTTASSEFEGQMHTSTCRNIGRSFDPLPIA